MSRNAFSIIELLISIAILVIIAVAATPAYELFSRKNSLAEGTSIVVSSLAKAELLSRAVLQDTGWGVVVQTSSVVIFNGSSLASSTASLRQTTPLPAGIIVSGNPSLVFTQFYGLPQATGTITISVRGAGTSTITVNTKGLISY